MRRLITVALLLLAACSEPGPTHEDIDRCVFAGEAPRSHPDIPSHNDAWRITACAPLDWPTGCRLAWLTCTPRCSELARWTCRQALCAQVSDLVDCNPLEPPDWRQDSHLAVAAAGHLLGVKDLSPTTIVPRYERAFNGGDFDAMLHPESPEDLRWTALTAQVQLLIRPGLGSMLRHPDKR